MTETSKSLVGETVRGASVVSIGTAAGQIVAFVGSLVLVRLYSPEQMGIFTTIVAVASVAAPLVSGRLAMAVPLPRTDAAAFSLARIAVASAAGVSLFITFALFLAMRLLEIDLKVDSIWWWGLPALVTSLAIYLVVNQLAVRFQKYGGLAIRGILYPSVMVGAQIGLGYLSIGSGGLIAGMAVGHLLTAVTLWLPLQRMVRGNEAPGGEVGSPKATWRQLASEYRRFPLYLGPAGMINGLATQLPQIGITMLFGLAVAGQYGMMMRILSVPVALIGQSIGFVYAGQISRARREGAENVRRLFDSLTIRLGIVSVVFIFAVVLFAEPVFAWLLGEEWRPSGEFAALFVVSAGAQLVSAPLSQTLVVSGRAGQQLAIDVIRAVSLLSVFVALYLVQPQPGTGVGAIAVTSAIGYAVMWILNRRAAGRVAPELLRK